MPPTTRSGATRGAADGDGGGHSTEPDQRNRQQRRRLMPWTSDADSATTTPALTRAALAGHAADGAQRRVAAAAGAANDVSGGRRDGERAADELDASRQRPTRSSARHAAAARSANLSDDVLNGTDAGSTQAAAGWHLQRLPDGTYRSTRTAPVMDATQTVIRDWDRVLRRAAAERSVETTPVPAQPMAEATRWAAACSVVCCCRRRMMRRRGGGWREGGARRRAAARPTRRRGGRACVSSRREDRRCAAAGARSETGRSRVPDASPRERGGGAGVVVVLWTCCTRFSLLRSGQ